MSGTVFVLGAGRTGLVAARDLLDSEEVARVVVGDIDTTRADAFAKNTGSRKVSITRVDLTNHQNLVNTITGSDALINATWYEYNVDVMKAVIEAKVHYVDMGGLFHVTRKQLELDTEVKKAGITAVLGAGESPGITNVMCACSAKEMDSVEAVRIRVGGREISKLDNGKLVFPFAVSTIFDEYSKPPIMFLEGKFEQVKPLSGDEEVTFPDPVGNQQCHYSIHSEIATIPLNFKGVRHVDFKLGISAGILRAVKPLLEAGMASAEPINVREHQISPRDFAIALLTARAANVDPARHVALRTEVTGTKNGRRTMQVREIVQGPSESVGIRNATALLTGIGASITAQLIVRKQIDQIGAVAPESCIPIEIYLKELEKRKIRMTIEEKQL
jgi:saccharopine dehydrogenase-like NADP-dependent oxidoreductase